MALLDSIKGDIKAARRRDPAATSDIEVILTYPGFHARQIHRLTNALHHQGWRLAARVISHFSRSATGIEIHPGAQIGEGFFIDHGMGVVIGETTIIGDDCTSSRVSPSAAPAPAARSATRPSRNVVVGAGAKVIGDVTVGENANIGAGSVVVTNVPPHATVVGVPGHVVAFADPATRRCSGLPTRSGTSSRAWKAASRNWKRGSRRSRRRRAEKRRRPAWTAKSNVDARPLRLRCTQASLTRCFDELSKNG